LFSPSAARQSDEVLESETLNSTRHTDPPVHTEAAGPEGSEIAGSQSIEPAMDADEQAASAPLRKRKGDLLPRLGWGFLSVAVIIGAYWIYTVLPGSNQVLTPTPSMVVEALVEAIADGSLFAHIGASLYRVLVGFAIGVVLAVLIGCTAGWFRLAGYLLDPIIEAIRPIPALAYIPLVIVWVGIDEPARIVIIVLAVFKPTVVNTRQGMKEIPNIYVEAAESLGASKLATFWRVALPNAVPFIMSGMRTGLATGFLALVAAELIASSNGLGFLISNAGQTLQIDIVLMGIVVIGIVATILDTIAVRIQSYLTRWSEVRR
jgi:ABC-type nitrate/sulfonate/bicarbonate transport system permease component